MNFGGLFRKYHMPHATRILPNNWLILASCQPIWGYFMPSGLEIAFIEHFYLHFLHMVLLNTNNI